VRPNAVFSNNIEPGRKNPGFAMFITTSQKISTGASFGVNIGWILYLTTD
jgi:hypothetical protein